MNYGRRRKISKRPAHRSAALRSLRAETRPRINAMQVKEPATRARNLPSDSPSGAGDLLASGSGFAMMGKYGKLREWNHDGWRLSNDGSNCQPTYSGANKMDLLA